jgi:hypothetical protein
MPVESPKFDASIRDLRQIRGVTGDLESRICISQWAGLLDSGAF